MHQHASLRISPSRPTVVMVPLRRTGSLVSAHRSPRTDRSRDEGEVSDVPDPAQLDATYGLHARNRSSRV